MNFRRWNLTSHEKYQFDVLATPDALRVGWSLPEEGTQIQDKDQQEIFRNDLVEINDRLYWVRYVEGGYLLEFISPPAKSEKPHTGKQANNIWLHEAIHSKAEVRIVGNSHLHADYLVQYINSKHADSHQPKL